MSSGRGVWGMITWATMLAALGVANWQAATYPIDASAIAAPKGGEPATAKTLETSAKPGDNKVSMAELSETLARPLFNVNRRPRAPEIAVKAPDAPAPPPPAAGPPPAQLHLIGMMRAGSSKPRALIRIENAPTATWIDVGTEIAGWRLSEVANDHVVIEGNGQRVQLMLYADKTR